MTCSSPKPLTLPEKWGIGRLHFVSCGNALLHCRMCGVAVEYCALQNVAAVCTHMQVNQACCQNWLSAVMHLTMHLMHFRIWSRAVIASSHYPYLYDLLLRKSTAVRLAAVLCKWVYRSQAYVTSKQWYRSRHQLICSLLLKRLYKLHFTKIAHLARIRQLST